jgi:ATP-dependent Clp protease ATP-binding subunit ClpC
VRRNPYSVVLFDEIEKAHPDVFNLLLQTLEDGSLTDSQGRKVSFKSTVIIMTTNLGARIYGSAGRVGFTSNGKDGEHQKTKERVEDALKSSFRPELLNRIDEIIIFKPLDQKTLSSIVDLMLARIIDRIESTGVFIEIDESVKNAVLERTATQEYGARPLRREITKLLEDAYAEAIIRSRFLKGDFIFAWYEDGKVNFEKRSRRKPQTN